MYQVNIGTDVLYYPGSQDAIIYDTELTEDVGLAGEFRFKVPAQNPQYSKLSEGALITIYKNGSEFWRGEIRNIETDFAKVSSVYCLEDLAWLGEEYLTPAQITNETYTQRFQSAISAYNANRPADRQFTAGYISNVTPSANCNWKTEYEWSILESLRECICKKSSDTGYLRVRRVTSNGVVTRYIDIVKLSQYGKTANQPIEYGYNLLDYVKEMDYGNLVNVLTPYGDELETEVYSEYNARLQGTTITNTDSVAVYGRHAKAVVFDGVSNVTSLNNLAASYLSRYSQPQLSMEVSAVDLAEIEPVEEIMIGDKVRIIAAPFAIDQYLYLTQIKRDLQNLDKNTITMSGHVSSGKSITSQLNSAAEAIEDVPSKWSILESAKKNALAMLLDETQGGHVVFEYDPTNSYIEAISICDASTIAASEKRWRWSQNGFGYMHRSGHGTETSPPWESLEVAIDINGNITANAVTTGTMSAKRIKGDTLTLGGNNNANGSCEVKNSTGDTVFVKLDNNGIEAVRGYIGTSTQGWEIQDKYFRSKNGPLNKDATATPGTYFGTDGFLNTDGTNYTKIAAGGITTNNGSITGATIKSYRGGDSNNGSTTISGGDVTILSDAQNYFEVKSKSDSDLYVTMGPEITVNWGSSSGERSQHSLKYLGWAVEDAYQAHHSDKRSKKKIKDIPIKRSREIILGARPRFFEFKKTIEPGIRSGFIAQELRESLDKIGDKTSIERESKRREGYREVVYEDFIAHLVNTTKELYQEIDNLKNELKKMKGAKS